MTHGGHSFPPLDDRLLHRDWTRYAMEFMIQACFSGENVIGDQKKAGRGQQCYQITKYAQISAEAIERYCGNAGRGK